MTASEHDPASAGPEAVAVELLHGAARVVVVTGAGISAESGVPTFRGPEGLWKNHRPEALATPQAFRRDPCLVWGWYAWRRERIAPCVPNAGHTALARFAAAGVPQVTLVTQNVDGLHERAAGLEGYGEGPALPLNLHGSLFRDRCSGCGARYPGATDVDASSPERLPRCPGCRSLLRPDVVWFGESLDEAVLHRAFQAAMEADLCIAVGTSGVVHPAASIPLATLRSGGAMVEVNPEETALTPHATVSVRGPSASVLPRLFNAARETP